MKKTILWFAALIVTAALAGSAQDAKPDFSGKWVLDTAKSDFGMLPPASAQTHVIEHKDPKLKVNTTTKGPQGETSSERNYTTDGKENTNTQGPQEIKSTTKWDGKRLVTESKREIQGNIIEIKDTWELSEDGKGLTISRDLKSPQGETSQKLIYNKD